MAVQRFETVELTAAGAFADPEAVVEHDAPNRVDALALNDADVAVERFPNSASAGLAAVRAQAQRLSGAVVLPPLLG